jgi:RNA polymerase sigma factor (sigma-70 family)
MNLEMTDIGARHSTLCRRLTHLTKNTADAEDVAQDAYLRLVEVDADGMEIRSLNSFVNRISHNIAIDRLRRRQRAERIFVSCEESENIQWQWLNTAGGEKDPEEKMVLSQTVDSVIAVIDELPHKCSRAYLMTCLGNHSRGEIADELGVSISMIEKYVRRARHHVHSRINPETIFAS